jgi:hypothetical protein
MTKWERQEKAECERAIEDARFEGKVVCRCGNTSKAGLHAYYDLLGDICAWECPDCGEILTEEPHIRRMAMTAQFVIPDVKVRIGEPDHRLGYTRAALMERLMAYEWRQFKDWMDGQTMAVGQNGAPVFYTWDVQRFFGIVRGKEVFD